MRQKITLPSGGYNSTPGREQKEKLDIKYDKEDQVSESEGPQSKVSGNGTSVGALRYALHLRFICPSHKKYSRCKSGSLSGPQRSIVDNDGERLFYLYNDLRVVFPQRHLDADEGKVRRSNLVYNVALHKCTIAYIEFLCNLHPYFVSIRHMLLCSFSPVYLDFVVRIGVELNFFLELLLFKYGSC